MFCIIWLAGDEPPELDPPTPCVKPQASSQVAWLPMHCACPGQGQQPVDEQLLHHPKAFGERLARKKKSRVIRSLKRKPWFILRGYLACKPIGFPRI